MSPFDAICFLAMQEAPIATAGGPGQGQLSPIVDPTGLVLTETWQIFFYAFVGSLAVNVVSILAIYQANQAFPPDYKKFGYWFFRLLLAVIGGILAFASGASTPLLALQIGATAPALIERFLQAPPPSPAR